mmetsp:Transcript_24492/g.51278  ORF Transcript_24492/g.51278 Transcript_24492/m.51278 type:complete len:291 (-) Transcript_24492:252-1124(-)
MRIAWLGNSYTYFNDLPSMVAAMLMAAGVVNGPADGDNPKPEVIRHAQVTPGGERFCGHAANPKAIEMLARVWDVVVLQDNSGVPGGASKNAYKASLKALQEDLAPLTTRSAHCILYSTWGHLHGSVYEKQRAAYPDYLIMQRLTTAGCEAYFHLLSELRSQNDNALRTSLAPVGDAFLIIYEEEVAQGRTPTHASSLFSRLFVPDHFHPSRIGTYLAACTFVELLIHDRHELSFPASWRPPAECAFDESLRERFGSDWRPERMSDEEAARLQHAARKAVSARINNMSSS